MTKPNNLLITKPYIYLGLLSLLLSGCSQQATSINSTVKEAFFGFDDINMSAEQVQAIPYASQFVRVNDGQKIFMVLAFAETNPKTGNIQLKWLSSDYAMVVTENGVITKTLKLPSGNLLRSQISPHDWQAGGEWQSLYDWPQASLFSVQAKSKLTQLETAQTQSMLWNVPLSHWQEKINFPQINKSVTNEYWLDRNGQVLKSIQYLGPEMTKIEMEAAKPFMEAQ